MSHDSYASMHLGITDIQSTVKLITCYKDTGLQSVHIFHTPAKEKTHFTNFLCKNL